MKKYSDLYRETRKALLPIDGPHQAGSTARELLQLASGKSAAELLADGEKYADTSVCTALEKYVERMVKGEPLAYILGEWEFYGLKLYVTPDVLIPRDDTVAVTSLAIQKALFMQQDPRILDLCCGSGCIGLAIASRVKDARVTLADLSKDALAVAKKNMLRHKFSGRVSCVQADALKPAPAFLGKFDMIVSNPPYITSEEMKGLEESVVDFEPHMALFGGEDGLDFYRFIAAKWKTALRLGGTLIFEVGIGQAPAVEEILALNGYEDIKTTIDSGEIWRVVEGTINS